MLELIIPGSFLLEIFFFEQNLLVSHVGTWQLTLAKGHGNIADTMTHRLVSSNFKHVDIIY